MEARPPVKIKFAPKEIARSHVADPDYQPPPRTAEEAVSRIGDDLRGQFAPAMGGFTKTYERVEGAVATRYVSTTDGHAATSEEIDAFLAKYDATKKDFDKTLGTLEKRFNAAEKKGRRVEEIGISAGDLEKLTSQFKSLGYNDLWNELDFSDPLPPGGVARFGYAPIRLSEKAKAGKFVVKTVSEEDWVDPDEDVRFLQNSPGSELRNLRALGIELPKEKE